MSNTKNSKYPQEIILNADNEGGLVYCTKDSANDAWDINYPFGSDRFYGTVAELKAKVKAAIVEANNLEKLKQAQPNS